MSLENQTDAAEATTLVEAEELTAAALTTLLQQEARNYRNETWAIMAFAVPLIPSSLWMLLTEMAGGSANTIQKLCFSFVCVIDSGLCLWVGRRFDRRSRSLTNALARINNRTQVGPLIRTLQVRNPPVRKLAKQSLIALLPTLRASDASLLGAVERKILMQQLAILPNDGGRRDLTELVSQAAEQREMDLRLAILKALEQVGGEQELKAVEQLAHGQPPLHSSLKVPDELRVAAKACLPYLQARADERRAGAQLLRASSLPLSSGDDLLRPATSSAESRPEQLLRAVEPRV